MKVSFDIPDDMLPMLTAQAKSLGQTLPDYCQAALLYQTVCWRASSLATFPDRETYVVTTNTIVRLERLPVLTGVGASIGAGVCDGCGHRKRDVFPADGAPAAGAVLCADCIGSVATLNRVTGQTGEAPAWKDSTLPGPGRD